MAFPIIACSQLVVADSSLYTAVQVLQHLQRLQSILYEQCRLAQQQFTCLNMIATLIFIARRPAASLRYKTLCLIHFDKYACAGIAQMLDSTASASGQDVSTANCVHSAADLLWSDGLDAVRQLLAKDRQVDLDSPPLGATFELASLQDVTWFCAWKGLGAQDVALQPPPKVPVAQLCALLGVPGAEQPAVVQQLRRTDLPLLQQAVLPTYLPAVVMVMSSQLPGLDLAQRHAQKELKLLAR